VGVWLCGCVVVCVPFRILYFHALTRDDPPRYEIEYYIIVSSATKPSYLSFQSEISLQDSSYLRTYRHSGAEICSCENNHFEENLVHDFISFQEGNIYAVGGGDG